MFLLPIARAEQDADDGGEGGGEGGMYVYFRNHLDVQLDKYVNWNKYYFQKGAHIGTYTFIHSYHKECMRKFLHSNIERSSRSQEEPNVVLKKNGNKIR